MQLDDLEKRENLSTEEIIQIASKLSCDEVLHCSVPIMPIIRLVAHLHDKSCMLNATSINLEVLNPEQMRFGIVFQVHPTTVQNARIVGRSRLDPGILNVEDLANIFGLDAWPSGKYIRYTRLCDDVGDIKNPGRQYHPPGFLGMTNRIGRD